MQRRNGERKLCMAIPTRSLSIFEARPRNRRSALGTTLLIRSRLSILHRLNSNLKRCCHTLVDPLDCLELPDQVYLPCVLMAKKRYVGFKYENPDDIDPVFDAKGIETVRRDGVPAQQKMTETCLKCVLSIAMVIR